MYLGIFGPGPNPSACFIENGNILFWAEEERFTRIKTSPFSFPTNAIKQGLKFLNKNPEDIKAIGYAWDCLNYEEDSRYNFEKTAKLYPSEMDYLNRKSNEKIILTYDKESIEFNIKKLFSNEKRESIPPVKFYSHHLCHAASCVSLMPEEDSVIIVNDGAGEVISSSILVYKNGSIQKPIKTVELPNTLGGIYASVTEFLGYRPYEDEGRVMGLACYGEFDKKLYNDFQKIITHVSPDKGFYLTDPTYRYNFKRTYGNRYSNKMVELFGNPRQKNESPMKDRFKNIAYTLQLSLEEVLLKMSKWASESTGIKNAMFAGGVHMNCKANGVIIKSSIFEKCFFQPAASDNGVSLGAAYLVEKEFEKENFSNIKPLTNIYSGTSYTNEQIKKCLEQAKLKYKFSEFIAKEAAKSINDGKLIGWFQGRMEVGARSLGGRSILASPVNPEARNLVNINVKNREPWRPFCPSIKANSMQKYILLDGSYSNPNFMITAHSVKEKMINLIPSCVHIDNTARPQAVEKNTNLIYWSLLDELEKLNGHPVVLNTSFNVKGEPIIENPEQAIRCFFGTGLDELFIGNFIVYK